MRKSRSFLAGIATLALALTVAVPAAAEEMSIEGQLTGDHWIDETAPACDLPDTSWRFFDAAAGELSGIGEVEVFTTHCTIFDPASGGANSAYYHRTTIFTTAEGDTLATVHQVPNSEVFVDDAGNFTGFTLEGTWEAVGGTGRFRDATGSGTMVGAAEIPGPIVLDFTGQIAFGESAE